MMDKMGILEKREEMTTLFDAYGGLLTSKQKNIFEEYYLYDLSFSEIAEELKISRSAVSDALKKTLAKLEEYEAKIGVIEIKKTLRKHLDSIKQAKTDEEKEKALLALKEYTDGI